jgi:hypothetical protein
MFHRSHFIAAATLGLALTLSAGMAAAAGNVSYFGRWTVSDDKPAFSAKGKLYKTVDIAACGKDFCGVSVDEKNHCGATLFRFLTIHAKNEQLIGHGIWGAAKKRLQIGYATPDDAKPYMYLGLGADDMDLTGREGSVPTFEANYKNIGRATCTTK